MLPSGPLKQCGKAVDGVILSKCYKNFVKIWFCTGVNTLEILEYGMKLGKIMAWNAVFWTVDGVAAYA